MARLIRGEFAGPQLKSVLRHLERGCERCREALEPLIPVDLASLDGNGAGWDRAKTYESVVDAACAAALARGLQLECERQKAVRQADLLLAGNQQFEDLPQALKARLASWGLCEELLARSIALSHDDPAKMVQAARLAVSVARRVAAHTYGRAFVADLKAKAFAELGNAYRVAEDLPEAEQSLERAHHFMKRGTGAPSLAARLAELTASLRGTQRRFHDAFRQLDRAKSLYDAEGDRISVGRVLISSGLYRGYFGDLEKAILQLRSGLEIVEHERVPKLCFIALHNIVLFEAQLGRCREARVHLFELRLQYHQSAGRIDWIRLRGLEGSIAVGLGELEKAETAFLAERAGFLEMGLIAHAAVADLELASVWLRQGRTAEVRFAIHDLIRTFRDLGVEREALMGALVLAEAMQRDALTVELVDATVRVLRRIER